MEIWYYADNAVEVWKKFCKLWHRGIGNVMTGGAGGVRDCRRVCPTSPPAGQGQTSAHPEPRKV